MTDAGVNLVVDPDRIGKSVVVGSYRLDVGPPVGMSISAPPEATAQAAEEKSRLSGAITQDEKDIRQRRGAVETVELSSDRADQVTGQVERADTLWKGITAGHLDVGAVNGEIDTLLALLQKLDRGGHFEKQLRLARALSRLLAVTLRWLDLLRSLRELLAAAERHGDASARAWALHELGTLHLAGGDLLGADRALSQAGELRRELGDARGLAATERNLQVLCRTLRQRMRDGHLVERGRLRRLVHVSNAVLALLFVIVFAGASAAVAASGLLSGGAPAAVVRTITQVVPSSGRAAGGTVVTITGTGFANVTAVRFGHTNGTRLTSISATELQVTTPRGSGTVPVTVITRQANSASSAAAHFTYIRAPIPARPTITRISPDNGQGDELVQIFGTGLANAKAVTFGTAAASHLHAIGDTQLQVVTPPGSGTVPVTAITAASKSQPATFTYITAVARPTITRISPNKGHGGELVTIFGTGLANANVVTFGTAAASHLHAIGDTQLQVVTPPGSGTVPVTAITAASKSQPATFTYITPVARPTITGISPDRSLGGNVVTITGTGLATAKVVAFDGTNGAIVQDISDTQLMVAVPASLSSGQCNVSRAVIVPVPVTVTVTTDGGTTAPGYPFTYACG